MKKICFATAAAVLFATSALAQEYPASNPGAGPGERATTHSRRGADVTRTDPNRAYGMTSGMARSPRPATIAPGPADDQNTEEGLTSGAGGSGAGGM
jgi:hypothetical protein